MTFENEETETPIPDKCPRWADRLIKQIRDIEISLGNVLESKDWASTDVTRLAERVFGDDGDHSFDEHEVELLFAKIARDLHRDGFEPADIASFINTRIRSNGRLPYCNENEVREALLP